MHIWCISRTQKKRMNPGIWMRSVFPGDSFGFVRCIWGVVVQVVDEDHGRRWPRHLKLQRVQLGKVDCLEIEGCGPGSGGLGWCIQTISNLLEIKRLHDHILVMNLSDSISEQISQWIKDKKYRHRSLDSGHHNHLNNAPSLTYYPVTPPRLGWWDGFVFPFLGVWPLETRYLLWTNRRSWALATKLNDRHRKPNKYCKINEQMDK